MESERPPDRNPKENPEQGTVDFKPLSTRDYQFLLAVLALTIIWCIYSQMFGAPPLMAPILSGNDQPCLSAVQENVQNAGKDPT